MGSSGGWCTRPAGSAAAGLQCQRRATERVADQQVALGVAEPVVAVGDVGRVLGLAQKGARRHERHVAAEVLVRGARSLVKSDENREIVMALREIAAGHIEADFPPEEEPEPEQAPAE